DLIVDDGGRALRELLAAVGAECGGHDAARLNSVVDAVDLALGQREYDGDRLQLRDGDDAALARRGDDVALIGKAEADPAADRRLDVSVAELRLRVLDRGVVGLDQR